MSSVPLAPRTPTPSRSPRATRRRPTPTTAAPARSPDLTGSRPAPARVPRPPPAYLYLAAIAVALTMIDFDVRRLPNTIVLPSYVVAGLLLVPPVVAHADWWAGLRSLAAMAALWTFYFALAFLYPGGMGFGDVKLAGLLGLYLGWLGWSSVLVGTFTGFLMGGLAGGALLVVRRAGRRSAIPFGPAMLAGALLALFVAGPVAAWYLSLLTPSA